MVGEDEASGKVVAIFDDIKATKGLSFVPNFWRVLATNADHLELVWTNLKTPHAPGGRWARVPPLDPLTREIIALAGVGDEWLCVLHKLAHGGGTQTGAWIPRRWARCWRSSALFNTTNTLADGYRVEPDVLPPLD